MTNTRQINTIDTEVEWNDSTYLKKLQEALNWLANLGVQVPAAGRHRQYEKILKSLSDQNLSIDLPRPSTATDPKVVTARFETHELDRIVRYFMHQEPIGIKSKFLEILDGSFHFYEDEGSTSSHARNTLAELTAGSLFFKYGLSVSYGDALYPEPLVLVDGLAFSTQCKRLSSSTVSAAARNLKRAAKQIENNSQIDCNSRGGIIFMDLSKILVPLGLIVVVPPGSRRESNYARKKMVEFMRENVLSFQWDKYPNVHGIIIRGAYFINFSDDVFSLDRYVNQLMFRERPSGCPIIKTLSNTENVNRSDNFSYSSYTSSTLAND